MKKIYLTLITIFCTLNILAQGWPANYGGVMLQGFYWDSYTDTQWSNLENQADTLSKYFNLIWVPQSGYCNTYTNQMGYADIWWFNQNSCFGTDRELKSMITTFKGKGLLTIADVVINHKNGKTNWCDFPTETWNGQTMNWSLADICAGDDNGKTKAAGYNVTGAADTGDDFDGCRDLDHTSLNVQKNIKLYLHFLEEEMGYSGFRYDMTGGYAPKYTQLYNEDAKPAFSVGEYWRSDGINGLKNWVDGTGKTSAAFDFELKWLINSAFSSPSNFKNLADYTSKALIGQDRYSQYAVTFVDNHDTGRESSEALHANIEAANAYILTMPGTPCIFLSHWKAYKKAIKKLILARRIAGITNQSTVFYSEGEDNGYSVGVKGNNGSALLLLGTTTTSTDGYELACEGENYKLYITKGLDLTAINEVGDEKSTITLPPFVTTQEGTYAYFEEPSTWSNTINVWAWYSNATNDNLYGSTAKWPGISTDVTYAGENNGKKVFLWKYSGTNNAPDKIIFNDGTNQTNDFDFVNGSYYTTDGSQAVVTGIRKITVTTNKKNDSDNKRYNLSGQRVPPDYKGIVIVKGKKYIN